MAAKKNETDEKTILDAYNDTLKKVFGIFVEALVLAKNDQAKIGQAEKRFQAGLATARDARDRAVALL